MSLLFGRGNVILEISKTFAYSEYEETLFGLTLLGYKWAIIHQRKQWLSSLRIFKQAFLFVMRLGSGKYDPPLKGLYLKTFISKWLTVSIVHPDSESSNSVLTRVSTHDLYKDRMSVFCSTILYLVLNDLIELSLFLWQIIVYKKFHINFDWNMPS